jgi:tetratricopeptide (TPR) repeat protein/tRNA A-37 threonylcarbamoyl transferase component Bud32
VTNADALRELLDRSLGGTYRIERELGGGGMSRVFLAEERALGRRVVIKVLSPALAYELSAERFAREIRLSAQLQHPNVVPVLAAGVAADVPYYTMPFIEGESLRARLARLRPEERIPLPEATEMLRGVARALAYAHGLGVVHRDIKPENVLLGNDAAVVADFGVAKAMAAARTQSAGPLSATLTQGGVALGTPAYMAPEQAAGDPAVDHRADVYAWGILAYEVLAGAHPFADRQSVLALVTAHLTENARPLDQAAPAVPPAIGALVMRCLAKNPNDRPGSARQIVDSLTATAAGSTAESSDSGRGVATRQPSRAAVLPWRPRSLALAAAALLTLAAAAAIVARLAGRESAGAGQTAVRGPVGSPGYDAYLRGKVRVSSENRQDNEAAIATLREAVVADPALAPAYAELARAYLIKAFYFAPDSERKTLNEDAEVAVERALSLDPKLAEAHLARGLMLWTPGRRFPHDQAVQAYRQALEFNPRLDEANHQLGVVYFHVGLLDQAQAEIEKALAINPGNTLARFRLGVIDMYRGEYQQAYGIFNSTPLERNPPLWAFQTATALFRLGRDREAADLIDKFLRDYPKDEGGVGHSVRAMMLAKAGRRREAEAAIATALEVGGTFGHFHHAAYNIGSAYALLGEPDRAIRWLQDAADNGFPCHPLLSTDRHLDGLRGNPRFVALLAKLRQDLEQRKLSLQSAIDH